ncbi:MAG: hypothetical protein DME23_14870 [Verrucomicrobia bacterium]|nr:MAG: hypothetical protein DME23_14870 [Verrucomicrobiota bacterium]
MKANLPVAARWLFGAGSGGITGRLGNATNRRTSLPLRGERAGVRESVFPNFAAGAFRILHSAFDSVLWQNSNRLS